MECEVKHKKNPLLDQLEILAAAIPELLKEKDSLTVSEKRALAHIRKNTRGRGTQKADKTE